MIEGIGVDRITGMFENYAKVDAVMRILD